MKWGKDFAIVMSNDAVHYGDSGWGGKNFSRFGAECIGYFKAMKYEQEIIQVLLYDLKPDKIRKFRNYTVTEGNYMEYKWVSQLRLISGIGWSMPQ